MHGLWLGGLMMLPVSAVAAPVNTDYLRSQWLSASSVVVPGQVLRLGLLLEHDPHWHTYWINPGDAGLATRFELSLPDGVKLRSQQWPLPERFELGGIISYGYSGRTLLPLEFDVDAAIAGEAVSIGLQARWLICQEECLPGRGTYSLQLPIATEPQPDPAWAAEFAAAVQALPRQGAVFPQSLSRDGEVLRLRLPADALPTSAAGIAVFPETPQLVNHQQQPGFRLEDGQWLLDWPRNDYFTALPDVAFWVLPLPDGTFRFGTQATDSATP